MRVQVGWLLMDPEDFVEGEDVDLFMDASLLSDYEGGETITVNGSLEITPLPLFVEVG